MPVHRIEKSAQVNATAATTYMVIADYCTHHPAFLPKNYFRKMEVEAGGVGEGTVFHAEMEVFGSKFAFRMRVSEPQPGRVIQETDLDSGLVTTFTVEATSVDRSTVTIASEWERPAGLKGWLDSNMRAMTMRRIYTEELALLGQYIATVDTKAA